MRWLAAAAVAAAACGDNILPAGEPLAPADQLTIVAHQDDDLLLMQPDLYDAVLRGGGVTNVYVTAGNGLRGVEYSELRDVGLFAAYADVADTNDWRCGWIEIADHAAWHCRLDAVQLSLVFLDYPDGGIDGDYPNSLLRLWEGKITAATTVARRPTGYDRAGVVSVLAEIIDTTAPRTLRTLELASTHGHDHSDHMLVGALAVLASTTAQHRPELISYRGYNIKDEPIDTDPALYDRSLEALTRYENCVNGCPPCGRRCATKTINPNHLEYLDRHYAIGIRRGAAGQLRSGDGCVAVTRAGDSATIVDCAGAPTWQLDDADRLRSSLGLCLTVDGGGGIVAAGCDGLGPGGRFLLDDEGHLWSGVTPPPLGEEMNLAHLYCVREAAGQLVAGLCGDGDAPTWELARPTTATPRTIAGITGTGRAVRMARLASGGPANLCSIEPDAAGLRCTQIGPGGGLAPAARIDSPDAPLAIEPESLMLGDIDGDGLTDACGRDAGGVLCATAASGYRAARWSTALASSGPATSTDRSMAIAHGKICGLADAGVICIPRGGAAPGEVHSHWPDRHAALWIANLDSDDSLDWCAATPAGPACCLGSDRDITTDGAPWGYAEASLIQGSAAEGALPDTATAVFTDVDGDGRDDLCTLQGELIACARSLGHGFAPRTPIARLPAGMVATALWAERATPGQPPRLCAADTATIACTE